MENTGVFRHIAGHGTAFADRAVLLQQNSAVTISDHHPERGAPSGIDRSAGTVEPSQVFIAGPMYDCASQSEYLGVEYLSLRERLINGSGRVAVA
jgi:hypothetical protein